jgi:hypothetical protein
MSRRRFKTIGTCLALGTVALLATRQAHAADHLHDGFYLRLGGGIGFVSDSFESEAVPLLGDIEGTITGGAAVGELAIGGAVAPGVILGGGFYGHTLPSPTAEDVEAGPVTIEEIEFESGNFVLLGPFIDYYFNPERGLHLQGSLGLGLFTLGEGEINGEPAGDGGEQTATGFAVMAGIGHEWWISGGWGLGLQGRFSAGWTSGEDDNEVDWNHAVIAPAILFTATMN